MYTLCNEQLIVSILDPVADRVHLGARYCAGGYIWQVEDRQRGPLLSGPNYPDPNPTVFNGQGLPESFANRLGADGSVQTEDMAPALILGVGVGLPKSQVVQEWCPWEVRQTQESITMLTQQSFEGWEVELVRRVSLYGRTLRSETLLRNTGTRFIPLRWFPHPFYPLTADGICCKFLSATTMVENPGYAVGPDGWIARKPSFDWAKRGHFQVIELDGSTRLAVLQRHPILGIVSVRCEYTPAWMPIWSNANTFSFEPYLERTVWMGQETQWAMEYDF